MNKQPIEYGREACETLMHIYKPEELPPAGMLFYHQGVFLSGMQNIYYLTKDRKFFNYIKDYADSVIGTNGDVFSVCHDWINAGRPKEAYKTLHTLDHKQPSIILYNLFDETGDEKYINAIKMVAQSMCFWPVNEHGGYWHMLMLENQMWLDGAYMVGPLSVMYSRRCGNTILRDRAIKQILIMDKFMKDEKSGLYYHGWDCSKETEWADSVTGLSSQIWGRAVGWYAVAIVDMLDYIPKANPNVEKLIQIEKNLLEALAKYQDPISGMWFQVIDKPNCDDNWVEGSCTNLFIYSYAKALRTGIISDKKYHDVLNKAYNGIINSLYYDKEGYLVVDNVCVGTGIDSGTYEHYINREREKNDLHGVGAFTLMCAEMQRYIDAGFDVY